MISDKSKTRLYHLATFHPAAAKEFFDNLLLLHLFGLPVKKMVLKDQIDDPQVLKDLACVTTVSERLLKEGGQLSFTAGGGKETRSDPAVDLDAERIFSEIRECFKAENQKIMAADAEIRALTLYRALWLGRILLYRAGETRAAGLAQDLANGVLRATADVLEEICGSLDDGKPMRNDILKAARLIKEGNHPAANAKLLAVTASLEKFIGRCEVERISRPLSVRRAAVEGEEILRQITVSPDGTWVLPQRGFRRAGPVLRRELIEHHVEREAVTRREGHKIDYISSQFLKNADLKSALEGLALVLRTGGEIDLDAARTFLAIAYLAYEKGIVRQKFKARLMIELALELLITISWLKPGETTKRLSGFAGSMCSLAAQQLGELNIELCRQLKFISVKKDVLERVIADLFLRANLQDLSNRLASFLSDSRLMDQPRLAWLMRAIIEKGEKEAGPGDQAKENIKRSVERLTRLKGLLAQIGRLNQEKELFRKAIIGARKLSDKAKAVGIAEKNLGEIKAHNSKLIKVLTAVAEEIFLIKFDLERQAAEVEADSEAIYLRQYEKTFAAINGLNGGYQRIFDAKGEVIGAALPLDIQKLKLRTQAPA